ncbi:MAG TPA: hypothetical protein VNO33_05235 [Kofleriaceae bacterium]|nr:hypothetical protein [Kofleriaceae bacterium]
MTAQDNLRIPRLLFTWTFPLLLIACVTGDPQSAVGRDELADSTGVSAAHSGPPVYIDAARYFTTPDELEAWYRLLGELVADFDAECGDTFCEGEYSNYQSLRMRCSAEERTGAVGSCVWILAASSEEIAQETGAIAVEGELFSCKMPVGKETAIDELVQVLSEPGVRPIRVPLPGSGQSMFDGLAACL